MTLPKLLLLVSLAVALPLRAKAGDEGHGHSRGIEPNAGQWQTWVIPSGEDFRVPPPPSHADTLAEIRQLESLIRHNDDEVRKKIKSWDAGAPAYRWMNLISSRGLPV